MRETPATPQLPLDFELKEDAQEIGSKLKKSNVVAIRVGGALRKPRSQNEIDSVLEDVLSNAKKLNW